MCCTRLAENTGRKHYAKIAVCAPSHNFVGYIFATKGCIDNRKKNLLSSNISSRGRHNMVNLNFGPSAAEIALPVWVPPADFNGFRFILAFVTTATLLTEGQPNFARCLAVSRAGTLSVYTFSRPLAPSRNFARCKIHFASKSCVLHCQRYCTALQQRGQPNFPAWYKEWGYGTFAEGATYIRLGGHHVWHRRTFQFYQK